MARPGNDFELMRGLMRQPRQSPVVQIQNHGIVSAYDEQSWGFDALKSGPRQVWPAAPGNHSAHRSGAVRRGDESGGGSGAGPKIAKLHFFKGGLRQNPARDRPQAPPQPRNIEAQLGRFNVNGLLFFGQQIDQNGADAAAMKRPGHLQVPGAMAAAPAAMRKHNHAAGAVGNGNVGGKLDVSRRNERRDLWHGGPPLSFSLAIRAPSGAGFRVVGFSRKLQILPGLKTRLGEASDRCRRASPAPRPRRAWPRAPGATPSRPLQTPASSPPNRVARFARSAPARRSSILPVSPSAAPPTCEPCGHSACTGSPRRALRSPRLRPRESLGRAAQAGRPEKLYAR